MWYSTEPRTRKYGKGYGSLSFVRNVSDRCEKKFIGTATKTGLDAAKTAEATSELIGNKVADKIAKPKTYIWCKIKWCWRNSSLTRKKAKKSND